MNDDDVLSLKRTYMVLQSIPPAVECGPLRGYAPEPHEFVQRLWREIIDPAVALVDASSRQSADGTYVAQAASPWHAYFYLRAQQQYIYRAGRPLGSAPSTDSAIAGDHVFFRGQRCASWPFKSSLQRTAEAQQVVERRAVLALADYFRFFTISGDIPRNTAQCFAQHYGIATDFADVSCDPDVAVWFATHPIGKPCPSGELLCAVRCISWAGQQDGAEVAILLPPPFVRNVYRQRGLFLDTSATGGELKGKLSLEVRFPRETAGGEFVVVRNGLPLEVWPEPDDDERTLTQWAREIGATCEDEERVRSAVAAQREAGKLPAFWLSRNLYDFEEHVIPWLAILDWVLPATCVTALPVRDEGAGPMRYEVLEAKAASLVRANRAYFAALAGAAEEPDFLRLPYLKPILTLARNELSGH